MSVTIVKGNLFDTTDKILCHCISADYKMGAGIAVDFRRMFGIPKEKVAIGNFVITENTESNIINNNDKIIVYNLVTKTHYFDKPKLKDLQKCLECMRDNLLSDTSLSNDIDENICISMPKIGCGLDKLDWDSEVLPMIKHVFLESITEKNKKFKIKVFYL